MRSRDKRTGLPEPECKWGYTNQQIEQIMGDRVNDFHRWMAGQTVCLCEGVEYNHAEKRSIPSGCGPHGVIIYPSDVMQFLDGGRPLD